MTGTEPIEPGTRSPSQLEDSLRSAGQRRTSILWETTQKDIALTVIRVTIVCAAAGALAGRWLGIEPGARMAAFGFLYGVANLVIGFYFGRTNHQRVGGPGGDEVEERR